MAFCAKCGTALKEGSRFCEQCGTVVAEGAAGAAPAPAPVAASGLTQNVAGLLCYVGGLVTGILFLVLEPYNKDPFIRFHAFQSIFFCVAAVAASIVLGMVPYVGFFVAPLVGLGTTALWVILMIQAYQNKKWKLPVIGDLAEKQV